MKLDNKIQKIAVVVIVIVVVFYISYQIGIANNENKTPVIEQEISKDADFDLFWEVIDIIKSKHIDGADFEYEDIMYGAIEGAVNSLGDPYSSFFPPEDAQRFSEDISGNFGGIGAEIGIRDNQLIVISPLKNSPAEIAGLKGGDKILGVDDESTKGISVDKAVKIIRGEEGTNVVLLISREEWDSPREISITRGNIEGPTLDYKVGEDKIAYIQLYSFNTNAPRLFYEASFDALTRGSKGLVLDLRNNSGGYLDVAVNIAGWFLDRGDLIVREEFPLGKNRDFRSTGNGAWGNLPVVVLVNGGSASASEILAGALKNSINADVVGENTFGKGTVQEVETLRDGSKIKVTVAKWVLSGGEVISESGLEPNFIVEMTEEGSIGGDYDPQLELAMNIIREKTKSIGNVIIVPSQQ